jgi:flagellar biosynthetic protein FliP
LTSLRIIIVFVLRQALGLQQTPSNLILVGMALIFTAMFIMAPVFDQINREALQPYLNEQMPARDAILKGRKGD